MFSINNQGYFENHFKGMASTDFESFSGESSENAGKYLNKEGKPAGGDALRLESTSNLNGNSVKTTAHEVVSSTTEPLAENKEEDKNCGTTMEARSGHKKGSHREASELVSKRKLVNSVKLSTYKCYLRSC